jgi:hypothetical protein
MKTIVSSKNNTIRWSLFLFMALLFIRGIYPAQSSPAVAGQAAGIEESDYAITQVNPHSRVWRNSLGQSVAEIATGMNYWDGQQWTPSNPSFVVSPNGTAFVATQIQDPTQLAANLNCAGAVTVTTPDNITLSSTPIAIGLYDAASGLSAIVATLTNTTGVLVDPQDVVYDRALVGGGFAASVVYSLPDTGSFHQDVTFVGFDPGFNPTNWGFAETSTNTLQIQIITEFYDPPQPIMMERPLYIEQNPAVRASMASPDIIDYTLDFGDYVFGPGLAYTAATNAGPTGGTPVAKDFVTSSGRTFLIESVPYLELAGQLQTLPPVTTNTSSLRPGRQRAKRMRIAAATLPPFRNINTKAVEKIIPGKKVALAIAKPRGVTVDYVVTVSSTTTPVLYSSDTTYFVSGNVYDSSSVTMESAVFKYPTNNLGAIEVENTLTLATTNYRPAVFTAADDNTAGTMFNTTLWSGYTGNPGGKYYGNVALWLNTSAAIALNNLRFCYLNQAIQIDADYSSETVSVAHSELVDCIIGINVAGGNGNTGSGGADALTFNANNCLMAQIEYPFQTEGVILTGNACNCTIDSSTSVINDKGNTRGGFLFTNSIFSSSSTIYSIPKGFESFLNLSGGYNGFYHTTAFGSSYTTVSSTPYDSVGAGYYYLPSTSPFLTKGTTNISTSLLLQLQSKTTEPPLILTNSFTNYTVLTPLAQRDTLATAIGWHYDPIDYICACSVSNATLLLTNGVALAYYDNLGIWLQDGSRLVSQGTPNYRNYLVYYGVVQEQPTNLWATNTAVAQSLPIAPFPYGSLANPSIFLRLTTICAPQGETNLLNTGDNGVTGQVIGGLTLRDCEVYGAGANWRMSESNNTPSVGLTNNVFHRVPFAVSNSAAVTSYNNLFYGTANVSITNTTVSIRYRGTNSPNTNENNVFDGVTASLDGLVGYNAYLHGATNTTFQTNDIQTGITWLSGQLGGYYQATDSPLLNNGSAYATHLGLYHYTVTTNNAVEGTNIVSRGYHYVAAGSNGLPLDTNGDGIPDYLEDANGNGMVDSGEFDWLVAGDLGLTVIITQPVNNSNIP